MGILYQLVANGDKGAIDGFGKIYSKKVFESKNKALEYIPEFIKIATTPINEYDMSYLNKERIGIDIVNLELIKD